MAKSNRSGSDGYEVGYRKPPKDHQFKKGQSGNPAGRPKGHANVATVLHRIVNEKVVIQENGVKRRVSKLEAAFKQAVNRAAAGDLPWVRILLALIPELNAMVEENDHESPSVQADIEVLKGFVDRLNLNTNGEEPEGDTP